MRCKIEEEKRTPIDLMPMGEKGFGWVGAHWALKTSHISVWCHDYLKFVNFGEVDKSPH